jgi:hypothetical protein
MSALSPAAQAVLDSACESLDHRGYISDQVAAALRAAADQVMPETTTPWNSTLTLIMSTPEVRAKLLTIADELEAHQ